MKEEKAPDISIVIPIHNEEGILLSTVNCLLAQLPALERSFEIILAENGSSDRTTTIAEDLAKKYPQVTTFSVPQPNYGLALRHGIELARGTYVICDEVDICDVDFYQRAILLLDREAADLVVGSKTMPGANDKRPFGRRAATFVINKLLHVLLDFQGTDTHGLKAFRREKLLWAVKACVVDRDLFPSEFVIRASRNATKIIEIPTNTIEKRPPSINLIRRVPSVLKGLSRLYVAIRFGK